MPKVEKKRKNRGGGKTVGNCTAMPCKLAEERGGDRSIHPGDEYYTWVFYRGPRYFRHVPCGYPRRGQLTNSKMGAVYDAVDDADFGASTVDEIKDILSGIAETANEVASEYSDSASNIESSFPGSPTAEACQTVADELESWASDLESWESSTDEPDEDDLINLDEEERLLAWDEYAEAVREEARGLLEDHPEYEG